MRLDKLVIPKRQFGDIDWMIDSFRAYGQKDPITIVKNTVVDGVVRCLAARALGWAEIEVKHATK